MRILLPPPVIDPIVVPSDVEPEYSKLIAAGTALAAEQCRIETERRALSNLDPSANDVDADGIADRVVKLDRDSIALFVGASKYARQVGDFADAALVGWFGRVLAVEGAKMSALMSRIEAANTKTRQQFYSSEQQREINAGNDRLKPFQELKNSFEELRGTAGQAMREAPEQFANFLRGRVDVLREIA